MCSPSNGGAGGWFKQKTNAAPTLYCDGGGWWQWIVGEVAAYSFCGSAECIPRRPMSIPPSPNHRFQIDEVQRQISCSMGQNRSSSRPKCLILPSGCATTIASVPPCWVVLVVLVVLPSFTFLPSFLHIPSFAFLPSFLHIPSFTFLPSRSFLHIASFTLLPSHCFLHIPSFAFPSFAFPSFAFPSFAFLLSSLHLPSCIFLSSHYFLG